MLVLGLAMTVRAVPRGRPGRDRPWSRTTSTPSRPPPTPWMPSTRPSAREFEAHLATLRPSARGTLSCSERGRAPSRYGAVGAGAEPPAAPDRVLASHVYAAARTGAAARAAARATPGALATAAAAAALASGLGLVLSSSLDRESAQRERPRDRRRVRHGPPASQVRRRAERPDGCSSRGAPPLRRRQGPTSSG